MRAGQNRPFVLDIATSTVAANKVKVYDLNGKALPEGWVRTRQVDPGPSGHVLTRPPRPPPHISPPACLRKNAKTATGANDRGRHREGCWPRASYLCLVLASFRYAFARTLTSAVTASAVAAESVQPRCPWPVL